jgi:hypothetical protein
LGSHDCKVSGCAERGVTASPGAVREYQVPDLDGVVWLYECPMMFIPRSVHDFMERLNHETEHPHTVKGWDEMGPRYRAFLRYFRACEANVKKMVNGSM